MILYLLTWIGSICGFVFMTYSLGKEAFARTWRRARTAISTQNLVRSSIFSMVLINLDFIEKIFIGFNLITCCSNIFNICTSSNGALLLERTGGRVLCSFKENYKIIMGGKFYCLAPSSCF